MKNKKHILKNTTEKNSIVSVLKNWDRTENYVNLILITITELMELRRYIESKNYPVQLKINVKTPQQMDSIR